MNLLEKHNQFAKLKHQYESIAYTTREDSYRVCYQGHYDRLTYSIYDTRNVGAPFESTYEQGVVFQIDKTIPEEIGKKMVKELIKRLTHDQD